MKVVFVIPSLGLGGAERHLIRFANAIHETGQIRIEVIVMGSDDALAHDLQREIPVHYLHRRLRSPDLLLRLRATLRRAEADWVIGWSLYAALLVCALAAAGLIRGKCMAVELNFPPRAHGRNPLTWAAKRAAMRWLLPNATVISANSQQSVEWLQEFIGPGTKYYLIKNPISSLCEIDGKSIDSVYTQRWREASFRILAVGRVVLSHKGFDHLVYALDILRKSGCEFECLIVGDGPDLCQLRGLCERLQLDGLVKLPGAIKSPYHLYSMCDVFVLPSNFEGFPNTLLEAMQSSALCISTDCDSGPREIIVDGENGFLVPVASPVELARALQAARQLTEPRRRSMRLAARRACAPYTASDVAQAFVGELRRYRGE